jgi:hypothetical protein
MKSTASPLIEGGWGDASEDLAMNTNVVNTRPLPPGARVGRADVRMRPITCPNCWTTLRAHDVEEIEDGYRLACPCGLDLLMITKG